METDKVLEIIQDAARHLEWLAGMDRKNCQQAANYANSLLAKYLPDYDQIYHVGFYGLYLKPKNSVDIE